MHKKKRKILKVEARQPADRENVQTLFTLAYSKRWHGTHTQKKTR